MAQVGSDRGLKVAAYVVTLLFLLVILLPLVLMASYSVKGAYAIYESPPNPLPSAPRSVSIVLDYSRYATEGGPALRDRILRDSTLAMYVVHNELESSSVWEIKVFGTLEGRTVFYQRAHSMFLRLQLDDPGGAYQSVSVIDRTRIFAVNSYAKPPMEKYLLNAKKTGYSFALSGIGGDFNAALLGRNDLEPRISGSLHDEARDRVVSGDYVGTTVTTNWLLLLESYKYYFLVPQYMFPSIPLIAKYSFFAFLLNTLLVMGWAVLTQVGLCSLTAYGISRLFRSRRMANIVMFYFLVTLMVPFICILVPQLMMIKSWGMFDSYGAMLLPYLYPAAFFTYLFKGFFDQLPQSLFDAASMDGASEWYRFTSICFPLSRSIIAVVALNVVVNAWGDFFWYMMAADRPNLWTVNMALYRIAGYVTTKTNISMGLSFIAIVPVIALALVFSKRIKASIATAGIKG